jgi:hypothetical protein
MTLFSLYALSSKQFRKNLLEHFRIHLKKTNPGFKFLK